MRSCRISLISSFLLCSYLFAISGYWTLRVYSRSDNFIPSYLPWCIFSWHCWQTGICFRLISPISCAKVLFFGFFQFPFRTCFSWWLCTAAWPQIQHTPQSLLLVLRPTIMVPGSQWEWSTFQLIFFLLSFTSWNCISLRTILPSLLLLAVRLSLHSFPCFFISLLIEERCLAASVEKSEYCMMYRSLYRAFWLSAPE